MPYLTVNNVRFHYQQAGTGPDVVLIHGLTSSVAMWMFSGIIESLAADYRVTAYDLRGHGDSAAPPAGYTSAHMADDLAALHRELGLEPAYIVGHSFGGVVGMHAAVLYPELVRGLVLSDSFFPGLRHLEPEMGQTKVWQGLRASMRPAGVDIGPTVDFSRLFRLVGQFTPDQFCILRGELGPIGAGWLAGMTRLGETTAGAETFEEAGFSAEQIAAVEQPVAALYDEHTPFAATCRFLVERLPRCTSDVVPGAEHLALLQNAAAFVTLVKKHLERMVAEDEAEGAQSEKWQVQSAKCKVRSAK